MKLSKAFIEDIRELIRSARATVARGVEVVQVHTNFEIGRRIVQQEQKGKGRAAYGKEILKSLAERLHGIRRDGLAADWVMELSGHGGRPGINIANAILIGCGWCLHVSGNLELGGLCSAGELYSACS